MPSITPIVKIGKLLDESYEKKGKKWYPIIHFDLDGAEYLDSVKKVVVIGTFTDADGKVGKPVSCKTDASGECNLYGKNRKTSMKGGNDYSDFVLVSLSSGKTVVNPPLESTVTWKDEEEVTLD